MLRVRGGGSNVGVSSVIIQLRLRHHRILAFLLFRGIIIPGTVFRIGIIRNIAAQNASQRLAVLTRKGKRRQDSTGIQTLHGHSTAYTETTGEYSGILIPGWHGREICGVKSRGCRGVAVSSRRSTSGHCSFTSGNRCGYNVQLVVAGRLFFYFRLNGGSVSCLGGQFATLGIGFDDTRGTDVFGFLSGCRTRIRIRRSGGVRRCHATSIDRSTGISVVVLAIFAVC